MWVSGQRHAPAALPREGDPGIHFTVRRVGFGVDLDGVRKISSISVFEPRTLQPVVSHNTDCAIPPAWIVLR